MVSKKHLVAEVENLRDALFELVNAVHQHIDTAEILGYEAKTPLPAPAPTSSSFAQDRLRLLRLADLNALHTELKYLRAKVNDFEAEATTDAKVDATPTPNYYGSVLFDGKHLHFGVDPVGVAFEESKAAEQIRQETLEKVIEALELDQYRGWQQGPFAHLFIAEGGRPKPDANRFWDDINTALRVRAEDAEAEADEAAEQRIAAITRPQPSAEDEWATAGETIIDSSGRDE